MNQKCIVHNKSQFLAAFNCILDVPIRDVETEIILKRKDGDTTFLLESVLSWDRTQMRAFKIAKRIIKRTPAECFR